MTGETPARRRGRTSKISRERILDASLVEFAKHGYEGATTASVARRIGVTQPLIHYHFGSKEALWRAAVELGFSQMAQLLDGVATDGAELDPRERLRRVAGRFVHFSAKHPEVSRLIIAESAVPGPRLEWMTDKHLRPLIRRVEETFRAARDAGIVKNLSLESLIFVFLGALPHFFDGAPLIGLLWGIDPASSEHVTEYADTLVEVLTAGLLVPSATS
ncbi:MAG TPA: TetR/AcrR family transcriptional regulator [Candidatus Binatia bacterium]